MATPSEILLFTHGIGIHGEEEHLAREIVVKTTTRIEARGGGRGGGSKKVGNNRGDVVDHDPSFHVYLEYFLSETAREIWVNRFPVRNSFRSIGDVSVSLAANQSKYRRETSYPVVIRMPD